MEKLPRFKTTQETRHQNKASIQSTQTESAAEFSVNRILKLPQERARRNFSVNRILELHQERARRKLSVNRILELHQERQKPKNACTRLPSLHITHSYEYRSGVRLLLTPRSDRIAPRTTTRKGAQPCHAFFHARLHAQTGAHRGVAACPRAAITTYEVCNFFFWPAAGCATSFLAVCFRFHGLLLHDFFSGGGGIFQAAHQVIPFLHRAQRRSSKIHFRIGKSKSNDPKKKQRKKEHKKHGQHTHKR